MNNYAMSALSLQARLNSLQPQPATVAVDPKGFKSALQSFIQFLVKHEVSATLWLKLPKDDAWWEDIWQYGQQAAGCTIYSLGEQTGHPPDTLAASLRPIPIEQDSALKREYLCLAIADNFMGALLAARVAPGVSLPNKKRTLQMYCTTSARTMGTLSAGIKNIVEHSLPLVDGCSGETTPHPTDDRSIAGAAALSQWERSFPASVLSQNVLPLSEAFLTWQLQFQENLRSQLNESRTATRRMAQAGNSNISLQFLSQASQELQAPLTTIKTALTLLGSPTLKLAQRQRYLEMITTQCEHQKSLIKSIIRLLQIQTTEMETPQSIKLCDLIPGIVSTYQPIAEERGIMLAYTVPDNLAEIAGVDAEIKQIVIHLIKNGIQITPKGGRVWVSAASQGDRFVALTIQDSGSGIAKTDISQLFDPFYQVQNSQEPNSSCAGLGLTLVQQLVHRMGGDISVDSTPNHGTSFNILLPVYPTTAGEKQPASGAAHQTSVPQPSERVSSPEAQNHSNDKKRVANHAPVANNQTNHQASKQGDAPHLLPRYA